MTIGKRAAIFAAAALSAAVLFSAAACGGSGEHEHRWDDGEYVAATCGEYARTVFTCKKCGETKTEKGAAATGNHTFSGDVCAVCGYVDMSSMSEEDAIESYGFYHVDADGSGTYTPFDSLFFGSYPQGLVEDAALAAALDSAAGGWTSYGYLVEGEASDAMLYSDVEYGGTRYRGVRMDDYRPYYTYLSSDYSIIPQNGLEKGKTYWYEFEPLEWRVLDYSEGGFFLNTRDVIESQPFQTETEVRNGKYYVAGTDTYANEWSLSTVRGFLNGSFYDWAFTDAEKAKVLDTDLDNAATGYRDESVYAVDQRPTTDRVFLLSYQDARNADYGFSTVTTFSGSNEGVIEDPDENTRMKNYSDYSLSQGLRPSTLLYTADGRPVTWWMLRSYGSSSNSVSGVVKNGSLTTSGETFNEGTTTYVDGVVLYTAMGVSPAVNVKLW